MTRGPRGEYDPGFSSGVAINPRVSTVKYRLPDPAVPSVIASEKNRCDAFTGSIPHSSGPGREPFGYLSAKVFPGVQVRVFSSKEATGSSWICRATPKGIGGTQLIANQLREVWTYLHGLCALVARALKLQ